MKVILVMKIAMKILLLTTSSFSWKKVQDFFGPLDSDPDSLTIYQKILPWIIWDHLWIRSQSRALQSKCLYNSFITLFGNSSTKKRCNVIIVRFTLKRRNSSRVLLLLFSFELTHRQNKKKSGWRKEEKPRGGVDPAVTHVRTYTKGPFVKSFHWNDTTLVECLLSSLATQQSLE